jgi:hypothetical protein
MRFAHVVSRLRYRIRVLVCTGETHEYEAFKLECRDSAEFHAYALYGLGVDVAKSVSYPCCGLPLIPWLIIHILHSEGVLYISCKNRAYSKVEAMAGLSIYFIDSGDSESVLPKASNLS